MRDGIKLGPRAAFFVAVLLAASAVGILTPTLSNTVTKDVQVTGFAVALTVDGIPDSVAPGDLIRVVAAMTNSANRPVPAILRMEVRNPNNTIPDEVTVYAGCGAEEVVSGTRLIYYIGWHGPLLAPKGISFAAGTSIATVSGSIGSAEYWATVLHEVQERDPSGYESLVEPGLNASLGVRNSASSLLKALNYYGMVASSNPASSNLADWTLTTVFSERFVAFGGPSQDGFLVEIHPQSRGSFSFKLWAERPDALGSPHHPYTCGPIERILVTSGASEANFLANAALVRPKDRVVVDSPIYSPLRDCAAGLGGDVIPVGRDCKSGWSLDLDRIRSAAGGKAKLLVFANLNNPTSSAIGRTEMRELADIAEECNGYVLVDETFRELAFRRTPPSVAEFGPRMIALSTVTKLGGLGGLRVGWIVAHPQLIERCKAVKDYTTICGSSVSQELATWALRRWDFFRRRAKRILDGNRKLVEDALDRMPSLHGEIPTSGTVMFPHSDVNVTKLTQRLVRKYKTVIAEGRFFGLSDHFRLGLGGNVDELRRGLRNVRRALRDLV